MAGGFASGGRWFCRPTSLMVLVGTAAGLALTSQASAASSKVLGTSCEYYGPAPVISSNGRFAVALRATASGECGEFVLYDIANDTERVLPGVSPARTDLINAGLAVSDDGRTVAVEQYVQWDLRAGRPRALGRSRTGKWIIDTDTLRIDEVPSPKGATMGWFPLPKVGLSPNGATFLSSASVGPRRLPYVWNRTSNGIKVPPRNGVFGKRRVPVATMPGYMRATSVSPNAVWVAGRYAPSAVAPRKGKNSGQWCTGVYLWNTRTNVLRVVRPAVASFTGNCVESSVSGVADDGTTFVTRTAKRTVSQAWKPNGKAGRILGGDYRFDATLAVGTQAILVSKGSKLAEWNWRTGALTEVAPVDASLPISMAQVGLSTAQVSASADLSVIGYQEDTTTRSRHRLVVMTR